MARIRSVHPGLWTDEAFVSVSPLARILFIGVLTEADDIGCFEWKPMTLKMRVLPVDNVDVGALMQELTEANMVMRYAIDGRQFGAVRNFCRFQRPKKPKSVHPNTPEVRTYVALSASSSELDGDEAISEPEAISLHRGSVPKKSELKDDEPERVPKKSEPVPPKTEKSPQMEDGGGRKEERKQAAPARDALTKLVQPPPNPRLSDPNEAWAHLADRLADGSANIQAASYPPELVEQYRMLGQKLDPVPPEDVGRPKVNGHYLNVAANRVCEAARINDANWRGDWKPLIAWLTEDLDLENQILPAIRRIAARQNYRPPASLAYFDSAVRERAAA